MSLEKKSEKLQLEIIERVVADIEEYLRTAGICEKNSGIIFTYLLIKNTYNGGQSKEFCLRHLASFWDDMEKMRKEQQGGKE